MNYQCVIIKLREQISDTAIRNRKHWERLDLGHFYDPILEQVGLNSYNSVHRVMYHLDHALDAPPTCPQCKDRKVKWHNGKYTTTCSLKCSGKYTKSKVIATNMERYGVDNPSKSSEIKKLITKRTNELYGVDNVMHNECVKAKHQSEIAKVDQETALSKREKTNLKIYGHKHPIFDEGVNQKRLNTLRQRYGVDHPLKSPEIRQRVSDTFSVRYGRHTEKLAHITDEQYEMLMNPSMLYELTKEHSLNTISTMVGVSYSVICRVIREAGYDISTKSTFHNEVVAFINSIGFETVANDRTIIAPQEIDILVKGTNIGIECNGMYWHTIDKVGSRRHHIEKRQRASDKGVDLIQVYDWDWYTNMDILKSIISARLGVSNRIYARKTNIVKPTTRQERDFLNENHLQGYVSSSHCYGLEMDGEIVALMSFSSPRFKAKYADYELLRYCNKMGQTVVGGSSRLFKAFLRENDNPSVYSYANDDLYSGAMYGALGFIESGHTGPSLRYWNARQNKAYTRSTYSKKNLPILLENYDPVKSVSENLTNHGILRVWDSGNSIWVK